MKTRRSFLAICLGALMPWRKAAKIIYPTLGIVRVKSNPMSDPPPPTTASYKIYSYQSAAGKTGYFVIVNGLVSEVG